MTDSSIKKIKSCKGWWTFTSVCVSILIILLCITLLILILYPIVSTSSQFDINFKPNSFFVILALIVGLIMSYSTYALVLVYIITFISSLIWSVKAFNLISDKKSPLSVLIISCFTPDVR